MGQDRSHKLSCVRVVVADEARTPVTGGSRSDASVPDAIPAAAGRSSVSGRLTANVAPYPDPALSA
jgi:hypothetical protein